MRSEIELKALAWEWEEKEARSRNNSLEASEPQQDPSAVLESPAAARFVKNLLQSFDPRPIAQAIMSPVQTVQGMAQEHGRLGGEAMDAFNEGDYLQAAGYGASAAVPLLGPAAAAVGEQMGSGDVAGGLGAAVGTVGGALIPGGAAKFARAKLPAGLSGAAKRQYTQALSPTKTVMKEKADRVVPQLLERRVGGSRERLSRVAQSRSREALEKLAELEAKLPEETKVKIKPILDSLEKAKQRATGAVVDVGDGKPMLYGAKGEVISRAVLGKSKS